MRLSHVLLAQSHYEVLGLPRNASQKQIKTKFYQLSKQYHPDRTRMLDESGQKQATEKYRLITEAYETLSDGMRKREYDAVQSSAASSSGFGSNPYGSTRSARDHDAGSDFGSGTRFRRTKSRVYNYGREFRKPGSSPLDPGLNKGSNYDVPHFDYDRHLQQQKSYEDHRRRSDTEKFQQKHTSGLSDAFEHERQPPESSGLVNPTSITAVVVAIATILWYK